MTGHPLPGISQEARSPLYGGCVIYDPDLRVAGEPVLQAVLLYCLLAESHSRGLQPFAVSWRRSACSVQPLTQVLGCSYDELERARRLLVGDDAPWVQRRDRSNICWLTGHLDRLERFAALHTLPRLSSYIGSLSVGKPVGYAFQALGQAQELPAPRSRQSPRRAAEFARFVDEGSRLSPSHDDRLIEWTNEQREYVRKVFEARGLDKSELLNFYRYYSRSNIGFSNLDKQATEWQPFASLRARQRRPTT